MAFVLLVSCAAAQAVDYHCSGFVNTFAGAASRSDNDCLKLYNGFDSETDTCWRNIAGSELVMNKDWFEGRVMSMRSVLPTSGCFS